MKKIVLYTAIIGLILACIFGLYSLNNLFKEKRIIRLLTNDSCKYWLFIDKPVSFVGKGYCVGDTFVTYYKTRTGERDMEDSPTNWLIGDLGCVCKWKYLGDSIEDELYTWEIAYLTEDTLIRRWKRKIIEMDTLIYDR